DEWIRTRTGIRERRLMGEGEATSDMVVEAGRRALEMAGLAPTDLDLIVVATVTPDMPMPSCAAIAQHKLGARCPAFDLSAACAGFIYGLTVVDGLIESGRFGKVLLVGAEGLSRFLDWDDRTTCILFGDGAGAMVLVGEEQDAPPSSRQARGMLATHIAADGSFAPQLQVPAGGTREPASLETVQGRRHFIRMDGRAVFSQAVRSMSDACLAVLERAGLTTADVDWVLPHQANLRIIDAIVKRLDLDRDRVLVNLDLYGNTSSASIPIGLDQAVRGGRIREGDLILSCGLGAGLVWGAALLRW
ncbi:MAG TPA: beta-ketoacyl-ACP synthase III, partial [Kofleriaceae bacterium]|nr:beta-ketoacyl-ACP synthase III [Kofleriaceae bacterium]